MSFGVVYRVVWFAEANWFFLYGNCICTSGQQVLFKSIDHQTRLCFLKMTDVNVDGSEYSVDTSCVGGYVIYFDWVFSCHVLFC